MHKDEWEVNKMGDMLLHFGTQQSVLWKIAFQTNKKSSNSDL